MKRIRLLRILIIGIKSEKLCFSRRRKTKTRKKMENSPSRCVTLAVKVLHFSCLSTLVWRWRNFEVVAKTLIPLPITTPLLVSPEATLPPLHCAMILPLMEGSCCHHPAIGNPIGQRLLFATKTPMPWRERERLKVTNIIKKLTYNTLKMWQYPKMPKPALVPTGF